MSNSKHPPSVPVEQSPQVPSIPTKTDPLEEARKILAAEQDQRIKATATKIEQILKEAKLQLITQPQINIAPDGSLKAGATIHLVPVQTP